MRRRTFLQHSLATLGQLGITAPVLAQSAGSVTIAAAGDTVLGFNLQDDFDGQLAQGKSRSELFDLYIHGIHSVLYQVDLAVVNLECPFTTRGERLEKNFNFRARPELVEALVRASIDAVTVANNHAMDYGAEGMEDTCQTLDEVGIGHFGTGANLAEARRPLIVERNGLTIGFLGYYFQNIADMIEPAGIFALEAKPGASGCYVDLEQMRTMVVADVATLAPRVDAVIPFFHWGKEGSYVVQDYQIDLAHMCIDMGARAVLGAHPHRLQGVEVYKGAPIFYSLGNFLYGGVKNPPDTLTMIAELTVDRRRVTASVRPVQFTNWPDAPFQPVLLEGKERRDAIARIAELSAGFRRTLPGLG
jgi:poly-gamma-glutamate capsule biosynthesis protein CapA/YwtB (metallophosphatase superfamily)